MAAPVLDGRVGAQPNDATFAFGAEGANAITATITLLSGSTVLAEAGHVTVFLSSDAAGLTPVAAQTSLVVGAKGKTLGILTAATVLAMQSNATGQIEVVCTDTGVYSRYLNVILPSGLKVTSQAFTFA